MQTRRVGALALAMSIAAPAVASAQVLSRASSAVRSSGGSQSARPSGSASRGSSRSASSGSSGSLTSGASDDEGRRPGVKCPPDQSMIECLRERWAEAGLESLGGALFFWATVLGDRPYANGSGGYAVPAIDDEGRVRDERTAFRLEIETGYVLAGAWRMAAAARVQLPFYVDLATRYSLFVEPDNVDVTSFVTGRVDAEVRVIDANGMQLRLGGGLRHAHDALGSVLGGGFGIAMDLFLVDPLILSMSADVGLVGHAVLLGARASAGFIIDSTEIYVGYHYEGLFGDLVSADLGGVMLGVRAWL